MTASLDMALFGDRGKCSMHPRQEKSECIVIDEMIKEERGFGEDLFSFLVSPRFPMLVLWLNRVVSFCNVKQNISSRAAG